MAERRLASEKDIYQDALGTGVSFFTDESDKNIHPFIFIESLVNSDCSRALMRFVDRLDADKIWAIIDEIPEQYHEMRVLTKEQKNHDKAVLQMMLKESIFPTYEKLCNNSTNS